MDNASSSYLYVKLNCDAKQKRFTEGCSKLKRPEKRQVQERFGLDIGTHASLKVGQDQVSGGVNVPVSMPRPLQMPHENLHSCKIQ